MSSNVAAFSSRPSPAVEIAEEVLAWALADGSSLLERRGLSGLGDKLGLAELLAPPRALARAAASLAAVRAARLGLGDPPLGDARPLGYGGLLLAFCVGISGSPGRAELVASACPDEASAWDLVLRDAIVSRALAARIDEALCDTLRARSPLTAVLERPARGGEDEVMVTIDRLMAHPDGHRLLVQAFSKPGASPEVRRHRARVMDRARTAGEAGQTLVLDVYEAAFVFHRDVLLAELAAARGAIGRRGAEEGVVLDALALAEWFGPLARMHRFVPELVRQRIHLDLEGMLEGMRLSRLAERIMPEAL